jgi:hypothetical protein
LALAKMKVDVGSRETMANASVRGSG